MLAPKPSKKVFIKTYGCQMNVYDSNRMLDVLKQAGYSLAHEPDCADLIVLNTCAIREKATEKVYSELGRIRKAKNNNNCLIAVAGCVSQAEGEQIFNRAPFVDIVVGPQSYQYLPSLITKAQSGERRVLLLNFSEEKKFDELPLEYSFQGASAFVSIQEGCDKFCTFCVVPYTRGAEFSRPVEQVYREVIQAISNGAKEIVFLGQNVNAYHGVSPEGREVDLAFLISHVAKIPEVERIRYTTPHPRDMTEAMISIHAQEPKLMPLIHLPVQSGSSKILQLMNRKHTAQEYLDLVARFRTANPNLAFSTDMIVGFPGETDEDFADTMHLVEKVGYAQSFSFKYSPRPGTPAASKEQIPEHIKTERLIALQNLLHSQHAEFNKTFIGQTIPVLFMKEGKLDQQVIGKSPHLQSVYVDGASEDLHNKTLPVRITGASANSLAGSIDWNLSA